MNRSRVYSSPNRLAGHVPVIGLLALLVSPCLLPATATGQLFLIVGREDVLEEIGVNDDQKLELLQLCSEYKRKDQQTILQLTRGLTLNALSTAQQAEIRPILEIQRKRLLEQSEAAIAASVNEEQMARLRQLRIQLIGLEGLVNGRLNDELGLDSNATDMMAEKITEFQNTFNETYAADLEGKTEDEMKELYKTKIEELIIGLLSDEQRAKYEELKGPPAELPAMRGLR